MAFNSSAAEYSANAIQVVASNQPVIFTESSVPANNGLIFAREGSGIFQLASAVDSLNITNGFGFNPCGCGCNRRRIIFDTLYEVAFHANIAVPSDPAGTVEEITLALAIDGVVDPSSIMRFTPAAVDEYGNVGAEILVSVPSICGCSSVSVVNTSTQPINVQNANIVFNFEGVRRANNWR